MSNTLTEPEESQVSRLVHTSVDDAKTSLRFLHPENNLAGASGLEANLRILRAALEREKEGGNRSSLVAALRSTIRANEAGLESLESAEGEDAEEESAAADSGESARVAPVDEAPMVHLRFAPKSVFAPHPRLADIPMPGDVAAYLAAKQDERADAWHEDLAAFREGVNLNGIVEPLKVVPCPPLLSGQDDGVLWWVVDGRTRLDAAPENEEIPFVEVDAEEVDGIIETTITGRRTWTKGQKAYLAVIRHPELLEVSAGERTDLRTECGGSTREEIASRYGISLRLLEQAIEVVRAMDNLREGYPKKVEEAEMEVWSGTGLAQVLSGLKGFGATGGKSKPAKTSLGVAARHLKGLEKLAGDFDKWNQAELMTFRDEVAGFWQTVGDDFGDFLTYVRVGDAKRIEAIIAGRELAKEEGATA